MLVKCHDKGDDRKKSRASVGLRKRYSRVRPLHSRVAEQSRGRSAFVRGLDVDFSIAAPDTGGQPAALRKCELARARIRRSKKKYTN